MPELTKEEKSLLKNRLFDELKQLGFSRDSSLQDLSRMSESGADPIDNADVVQERGRLIAETERLDRRIRLINRTLNNWSDYGFCESCGDDIPYQRLSAQPTSSECIHCKEISEKKGSNMLKYSHNQHHYREESGNE